MSEPESETVPDEAEAGEASTSGSDPSGARRGEEVDPAWGRRGRTVVVHGALFTAFLVGLRIDKVVVLELAPSLAQWVGVLAPEVGLALLIESCWMLTVRVRRRLWSRLWLPVYLGFHVPIYLLSVTGHRYFYETLGAQKLSMILYAIREFRTVQGVIAVGLDRSLLWLCLLAGLCIVSGVLAYRWRRPWHHGHNVLLPAVLTLGGAGLVMWPAPEDAVLGPLAGNFMTDLLPNPVIQQYLERPVPTWRLYDATRLGPPTESPDPSPDTGEAREHPRPSAPARPPPNILLVVLESTRTDVLTAYGAEKSRMPFVDELASRSLVVDAAYTTVSHTTKALVGILCGMYPLVAMKLVEPAPGMLPLRCMPELLAELGYETAFFQPAGNFEHRNGLTRNMRFQYSFIPTKSEAGGHAPSGYLGWEEGILVEPVLDWVTTRKHPFFATVLTLSTHHPYQSPSGGRPRDMTEARGFYDAAATYADGVLRQLFDKLRAAGALDDTLVIVTGDHGEAFGDHVGYRQHDLVPYEEVTRVPLLLHHAKRLGEPRRLAGLRQHPDILPTVLEVLGRSWQGTLPGRSLLSTPGHGWVVSSCWFTTHCLSMRQQNLSFVFTFGRVPLQVFDVEKDPAQRHDIMSTLDPAFGERAIDAMLGMQSSVNLYYQSKFTGVPLE